MTEAGLSRNAGILGADAIIKMSAERYAKKAGMEDRKVFFDKVEAEAWLDSKILNV